MSGCRRSRLGRRLRVIASLFVLVALVGTTLAVFHPWAAYAEGSQETAASSNSVTDTNTSNGWKTILQGESGQNSTRYAGRVWTDKSVSNQESIQYTGEGDTGSDTSTYTFSKKDSADSNSFLVTYSAMATSQQITKLPKIPVDVVFVLDLSGSMNWAVDAQQVTATNNKDAQEQSRLNAMVKALNSSIKQLVENNPQNRIAIVGFNKNTTTILPLKTASEISSSVTDGNYLSISSFKIKKTESKVEADATIICNIDGTEMATSGGTNIQAGMYDGMSLLTNLADTTYTFEGKTYTRMPNVVLMSDGAPTSWSSAEDAKWQTDGKKNMEGVLTNASTVGENESSINDKHFVKEGTTVEAGSWWKSIYTKDTIGAGDASVPHSADGFMALLTSSYKKNQITNLYTQNAKDTNASNSSSANCRVYTIGFSTNQQTPAMAEMASTVLDPGSHLGGSSDDDAINGLIEACGEYVKGNNPVTVTGEIGSHAKTGLVYNYEVGHPSNDINDPSDFNYSDAYYPAEDSDELNNAFQQITNTITDSAKVPTEVEGNDVFGSGFVTYTDPIGDYMSVKNMAGLLFANTEFTEVKTSSLPEENGCSVVRYTFADKGGNSTVDSDIYGRHDVNSILVDLLTNNQTGAQTLRVQIPAALIPLRINYVEVNQDGRIVKNDVSNTYPLRLVYEVGPADGVLDENGKVVEGTGEWNSSNSSFDGVSDQYLDQHKTNGRVNLFSNKYSVQNMSGSEGVTTGDATVTFTPAKDNPFYFFQNDVPLYTDSNGEVKATGEINENSKYYFPITYYEGTEGQAKTVYIERSGALLAGHVKKLGDGQLAIVSGSPRLGNLADMVESVANGYDNKTGTASHPYYPTFDDGSDSFTIYLGNNGEVAVSLPGPDILPQLSVKKVDADDNRALDGAGFAIYMDNSGGTVGSLDESDSPLVPESEGSPNPEVITTKDGTANFSGDRYKFQFGQTYFLVEKSAPDGYQLMNGAVKIVFNQAAADGKITADITFPNQATKTIEAKMPVSTGAETVLYATVETTVSDEAVPSLPQTGSMGRSLAATAGVVAVVVASYMLWERLRSQASDN